MATWPLVSSELLHQKMLPVQFAVQQITAMQTQIREREASWNKWGFPLRLTSPPRSKDEK